MCEPHFLWRHEGGAVPAPSSERERSSASQVGEVRHRLPKTFAGGPFRIPRATKLNAEDLCRRDCRGEVGDLPQREARQKVKRRGSRGDRAEGHRKLVHDGEISELLEDQRESIQALSPRVRLPKRSSAGFGVVSGETYVSQNPLPSPLRPKDVQRIRLGLGLCTSGDVAVWGRNNSSPCHSHSAPHFATHATETTSLVGHSRAI